MAARLRSWRSRAGWRGRDSWRRSGRAQKARPACPRRGLGAARRGKDYVYCRRDSKGGRDGIRNHCGMYSIFPSGVILHHTPEKYKDLGGSVPAEAAGIAVRAAGTRQAPIQNTVIPCGRSQIQAMQARPPAPNCGGAPAGPPPMQSHSVSSRAHRDRGRAYPRS